MANPYIYSLIDKAVYDYSLIEKGDRILIGASGGKDSTALIEYFAFRKLRKDADFDFTALHIQSEFGGPIPEGIRNLFDEWNVDFKHIEIDVQGRLAAGKKMSCYWCSAQRRKELLVYAKENGYNKVALGHHIDDILATVIMNALQKAELSTMIPKLKLENFPVTLIRPLCYTPEDVIIERAKEMGYFGFTCTCNYQDNSGRKAARDKLEYLTGGDRILKEHLFNALRKIKPEYLP
ncbi:tRNA 2-thiocytidine biosynthesis TtcA family protein [Treponema sp.]|uniref:tRNA 2-thiocytidine biosynthesis TtcA family protein n=1 Tax=Treponema sp. TaxID=166 RepID=UPI0025DA4A4D|nr:tRNA 2-thiocytidine biosynthesis TtcA family protein [Treponema sp.]MCR5217568.1 tRNA 2-thiocytidine biosynthesis TtcA family protein [Treponema sp.]